MSDMPVVLLDCDGVIVDNVAFERRVTEIIIDAFAKSATLSIKEAKRLWQEELLATKGHSAWYDYSFHCDRLGLDGASLSRWAHRQAADLISFVQGAQETLGLLQEYGLEVGVVTDATNWVVDFKLSRLDLDSISFAFTSTDAAATKASHAYWDKLSKQYEYLDPWVLVDNRQINLHAAADALPNLSLIQFDKQEHVMTLPEAIAPQSNGSKGHPVQIIHNHSQLRKWVVCHIKA
jgi:phosphoglycolate phosphatase-like HAD superfamily hydrolase